MNYAREIHLKLIPQIAQQKIEHFVYRFKYLRTNPVFSALIKIGVPFDAKDSMIVYTKTLFGIWPLWYCAIAVRPTPQQESVIQIYYYVKGLSFLDIFGIKRKWIAQTETFLQE